MIEALIIISCLQSAVIVLQQVIYNKERKDLLNRIMSRDYHEFVFTQPKERTVLQQRNPYKEAVVRAARRQEDEGEG